jgi:hypothetical protein
MNPKAVELVNEYGDQAYYVAVEFTVLATHIGDTVGAELFAECARNLMEAGYHKHRKVNEDERRLRRPNETVRDERGGA